MIRTVATRSRLFNKSVRPGLRRNVRNTTTLNNARVNSSTVDVANVSKVVLSNQTSVRTFFTSTATLGNPWDSAKHEVLEMSQLTPNMDEGVISEWDVSEGDSIDEGDVIVSVETDKAVATIDAIGPGYIAKILYKDGDKVPVGSPIAVIVNNKDDIKLFENYVPSESSGSSPKAEEESKPETPEPTSSTAPQTTEPSQPSKPSGDQLFATPYARKLASEKGIDLSQIGSGTGPNSRIIGADVNEFTPSRAPSFTPSSASSFEDISLNNIKRVTAERLTYSKQNIPHYYLSVELSVDELQKVRADLNEVADGKYKISVNDFIIKAASKALKKVPEANSEWRGDVIRRYNNVDINFAVDTEAGLYSPLVRDTDKKGLEDISNEVRALAGKAKDNKLSLDDIQPGTFTVSNLGMLGINEFSAVINPPQACILAVGTVTDKIKLESTDVDENGSTVHDVSVEKVMKVTLSCDHRVVDGAVGARWLQHFKDYMENPIKLLL